MKYDDKLEEIIIKALGNRQRGKIPLDDMKEAAVLMPLFVKDEKWHILLSQRSGKVEHHKGEVSFPGGARETEDQSLEQTALRETWEEIGLPEDRVRVLGRVDDHYTYSGFRITPFVGVIPHPFDFKISKIEVDHLLEVSIESMLDISRYEVHKTGFFGDNNYTCTFVHDNGDIIWGATARIIVHFLNLIYGLEIPNLTWNRPAEKTSSP